MILIDEYDVPIFHFLREGNKKLAEAVKRYLNAFFAEIKASGNDSKLVFVTGVSNLPLGGVGFSVNIFRDISQDERFLDAMGISKKEVNHDNFKPSINEIGRC